MIQITNDFVFFEQRMELDPAPYRKDLIDEVKK
jgi:hypothetical protein